MDTKIQLSLAIQRGPFSITDAHAMTDAIDSLIKERITQAFLAYETNRHEIRNELTSWRDEFDLITIRAFLDRAWYG